jgi:hypothetical protein
MPDLLPVLSAEISAFVEAKDKREYLITRAEKFFDELVAPIDLPGPDAIIDPVLRSVREARSIGKAAEPGVPPLWLSPHVRRGHPQYPHADHSGSAVSALR